MIVLCESVSAWVSDEPNLEGSSFHGNAIMGIVRLPQDLEPAGDRGYEDSSITLGHVCVPVTLRCLALRVGSVLVACNGSIASASRASCYIFSTIHGLNG